MKIQILSIPVLDQTHALQFYTEILGFKVKDNIPLGGGHSWITLVSKEFPSGPELLLEPSPVHFEPAKAYQDALFLKGLPWTQFHVSNIDQEYKRLQALGVAFKTSPTSIGPASMAIFDDTCGNYIQLVELTP